MEALLPAVKLHAALLLLAQIELVPLHGPDNQRYWINPMQITSVREPIASDRIHFSPIVHCIIVTVSGKFMPVRETCDQVRRVVGFDSPM